MLGYKLYSPSSSTPADVCYFIFPGGLRDDLARWLEGAAQVCGMYMVAVEGVSLSGLFALWASMSTSLFGDATAAIARKLESDGVEVRFLMVEGTHFSPVVPRLELAFGNRIKDE